MKKLLLLLIISVLAATSVVAVTPTMLRKANSKVCSHWVDSVMAGMTLRQKVAQLMMAKLPPSQGESTKASLRILIQNNELGGVIFSVGTLEQYVEMTNYAQSISRVPLLHAFDGEWGLAMRIEGAPKFPQNMCLGAITDTKLLYDYGREMARQCRLIGVHANFAPVADVNSNPANPIIGQRSYGEDAARVGALATAYSKGLEDGGVLSVAKHFPGHGDTNTDSHKTLPVVNHDKSHLYQTDLKPFKTYIQGGCSGIMVGHLSVPALDASGLPTSLSPKVVTDILRKEMKFNGLIFTDALSMQGAAVPGKNQTLLALQAGADVLLGSDNPAVDIAAIVAAVNDGRISRKTIDLHCRRVLTYKYLLGLNKRTVSNINGLAEKLNSPQSDNVNRRLANAAVTALRNYGEVLPLDGNLNSPVALVNIGRSADGGKEFETTSQRFAEVNVCNEQGADLSAAKLREALSADVVVAVVYSDKQWARQALARLKDAKNLVAVFMINPYVAAKFKTELAAADGIIFAYDDTPFTREAAAKAVFGGIDVTGKLPVNLSGLASLGAGLHLRKLQ
jgi:beta-glucosidase-like glycosyl hydrolase